MHENPSWIIVSQETAGNISLQALLPAVLLTALSLSVVVLRWYSRVRISGVYGVEDVMITLALVLSMVLTGIIGGEFAIDVTKRTHEPNASRVAALMKLLFSGAICYHLAVNLVRFSILFQYSRIFRHLLPLRLCIYAVFLATIGATAWGVTGIMFICRPMHKYWNGHVTGRCMDAEAQFWSSALLGVILDCLIWLMPMPVLGRLNLGQRAKIGLLLPFLLGLFVCVVAVLRIVQVHGAAKKGDVSKSGTYAAIWSTAEVNVAIICSSLLVMKPLLLRLASLLGIGNVRYASDIEGDGIRRVMSFSTMGESAAGAEGMPETGYQAWISADKHGFSGERAMSAA